MPNSQAPQLDSTIPAIATASKTQVAVGLQLQAYCNSVREQPKVSFGGSEHLADYEAQVNAGLAAAQTHAVDYVDRIRPAIITNISNISNYFDLHNAVATTLSAGSTKKEWLDSLAAVRDQADEYKHDADHIVDLLRGLNGGLTTDVGSFTRTLNELNAAVNGDNGILSQLDSQISDVQGKIAGTIAGTVISGLAIAGGTVLILVGALAEAVTGGLSTALVVGGAAVLIAGVGGTVAAGLALGGLFNEQAYLINRQTSLRNELKLALGMKTGFTDLRDHAGTAVQAATAMQNAWGFLGADLQNLSADLNKGIMGTDAIREIWLTTANSAIKTVSGDIATIKWQMDGATTQVAPAGTTIGAYVTQVGHELAA